MSNTHYWGNTICTFEIVQNEELIKNKNNIQAIILTFFKREEYYKHFGIYVRGLKKCVEFVEEFNKKNPDNTYKLIMFVDRNIYNDKQIMSIISNKSYIVIVTFNCENFKQGDYHIDLFGTLVRFFPMFDFSNNPVGCCMVIDVDLHDEDYAKLHDVMTHKPQGLTAAGIGTALLFGKGKGYIFANTICQNVDKKYDHTILENFLVNAHKHESLGLYEKRVTTFGFGIDEIFLNEILIPTIKDFGMIIDYQISYMLFHTKDYIYEEQRRKVTDKIFSYILGTYDNNANTIDERYKLIDSATYHAREKTDFNSHVSTRFYDIIEFLALNKKRWMERNIVKFIYKYLMDIISTRIVLRTNNEGKLISVQLISPIYVNNPARANTKIVLK